MLRQQMELDRRRRIRRTISRVLLLTSRRKRKRVWERPKSSNWWEVTVPTFGDDKWLENFRLRKGTFDYAVMLDHSWNPVHHL